MRFLTLAAILVVACCAIELTSASSYGYPEEYKSYSRDATNFDKRKKTYSDDKTVTRGTKVNSRDGVDLQDRRNNRVDFNDESDQYSDEKQRFVDYKKGSMYGGYDSKYPTKKYKAPSQYNKAAPAPYKAAAAPEMPASQKVGKYEVPAIPTLNGNEEDAVVVQNVNGNKNRNQEGMKSKNDALSQNGNNNGIRNTKDRLSVRKNGGSYRL